MANQKRERMKEKRPRHQHRDSAREEGKAEQGAVSVAKQDARARAGSNTLANAKQDARSRVKSNAATIAKQGVRPHANSNADSIAKREARLRAKRNGQEASWPDNADLPHFNEMSPEWKAFYRAVREVVSR
ncbi:MAG TPA: hypothetical protein VF260_06810 [Bacilli bacterium]